MTTDMEMEMEMEMVKLNNSKKSFLLGKTSKQRVKQQANLQNNYSRDFQAQDSTTSQSTRILPSPSNRLMLLGICKCIEFFLTPLSITQDTCRVFLVVTLLCSTSQSMFLSPIYSHKHIYTHTHITYIFQNVPLIF